jgi:hypothetical protein
MLVRRCCALFLALLFVCCPLSVARAGLDPQLEQPYKLKVVLRIAEHRLLTDVFKDRIEQELRDSLQGGFGDLAEVEVVRMHAKLKEIEEKGLQQALDGWKEITGIKTHFVLIDFVNGQYEIQTRQHDGLTGIASPTVRKERTADRLFVTRTAVLMIDRDFGIVGTLDRPRDLNKNEHDVLVSFHGGKRGVPLDRWVKKDDVFVLVQIRQDSRGQFPYRVDWAVVQALEAPNPKEGTARCRVFNRSQDPFGDASGAIGCRCLAIHTVQAPLHLRLVQAKSRNLAGQSNQKIVVHRQSFEGEPPADQGITDADGLFKRGDRVVFNRVALVSVMSGQTEIIRIPVALMDDRTVVCPVSIQSEENFTVGLRRDFWVRRLYDNLQALSELFKDLQEKVAKPEQRVAVRDRARSALNNLGKDLERLTQEQTSLREAAKELPPNMQLDLSAGERPLRELEKGRKKLADFVVALDEIVKKAEDPKIKEMQIKVENAKIAEDNADFGQALTLYEEVLAAGLKDAMLAEHVAKLKAAWEVKDDKLRQARAFVYDKWPSLNLAKNKDALTEARKAFEICKGANDRLGPAKMLKVAETHIADLQKTVAGLQPDVNEDDKRTNEAIIKITDKLTKLITDVAAYLQSPKSYQACE